MDFTAPTHAVLTGSKNTYIIMLRFLTQRLW